MVDNLAQTNNKDNTKYIFFFFLRTILKLFVKKSYYDQITAVVGKSCQLTIKTLL